VTVDLDVDVTRTLDADLAAEMAQPSLAERKGVLRQICDPAVALMSIGLVFAVSTLPLGSDECGEIPNAWHEYLGFVVSLQAVFTGLASLVWLLVVNVPNEEGTKAES
jgi:hypothetical protein